MRRPGHEFLIFDYSSIESRVLAWLAGETWKLDAYREFDRTGDKRIEPYRIIASKMLGKDLDAISKVDRQTGKIGDLSAGFGGSVGAWRRQIADDRSDVAIKADIEKWRRAHPRDREILARPRALHSHRDQDRPIGLCRHAAGTHHHRPF